jgi:hypothetical protein
VAAPTTDSDAGVILELGDRYRFRDSAVVTEYLRAHSYLLPVLLESGEQIDRVFGQQTPVALHVVVDPEAEGTDELFALIETGLSVSDATARLDELDA